MHVTSQVRRLASRAKRALGSRRGADHTQDGPPETPAPTPAEPTLAERVPDDLIADVRPDLTGRTSIRASEMPESGPYPWLDRPGWRDDVEARWRAGELDDRGRVLCTAFAESGYVILPGLFPAERCDQVWDAYLAAAEAGTIHPAVEPMNDEDVHLGHVMNAHLQVPEIQEMLWDPRLLELVSMLLGVEPVPFQSLLFPKGRGQLAHSDTIHMTTYPLGYMCAAWIALEDIDPGSGPLCYYPGSHRLDRVFGDDVGLSTEMFAEHSYAAVAAHYEPAIQALIAQHQLEQQVFLPRKGDVLIWHDNLIHGGTPRTDVRPSRKSMVGHYFGRGALCYHDLSGKIADRIDDGRPMPVPQAV